MEQRTTEWHKARLGKVTASRFGDVMTLPRSKKDRERGVMSKTSEAYMYEIITEILTGESRELVGDPLDWGVEHESEARKRYELDGHGLVREVGYLQIETGVLTNRVGGSPDGLVSTHGLVEIKCPYNSINHIRHILLGEIPKSYISQMQGYMWITDRDWCDYVTYDPRILERENQIHITRIPKDEVYINQLEKNITEFIVRLDKELKGLHD